MSIDLKPCPHCGSEAAFRVVSHQLLGGEHPLAGMEYIDCNNKLCGASTIAMYSTGEDCKPLLAERWNCRFGAAIKAAQPDGWVSKWQPIETAPMDEMFLWGYWKNGRFSIGLSYRTVSKTNVDAYGGGDVSRFATHWLALPAAPMEAK